MSLLRGFLGVNNSLLDAAWQEYSNEVQLQKASPSLGLCPICGDKNAGFHYGIHTCNSCRGFFKRAGAKQSFMSFTCAYNNECEINMGTRRMCPACRFQKCIEKGMKLQAIRGDRAVGGRRSYQGGQPSGSPQSPRVRGAGYGALSDSPDTLLSAGLYKNGWPHTGVVEITPSLEGADVTPELWNNEFAAQNLMFPPHDMMQQQDEMSQDDLMPVPVHLIASLKQQQQQQDEMMHTLDDEYVVLDDEEMAASANVPASSSVMTSPASAPASPSSQRESTTSRPAAKTTIQTASSADADTLPSPSANCDSPGVPQLLQELSAVESRLAPEGPEDTCCEGRLAAGDDDHLASLLHLADHCLYRLIRGLRNLPQFTDLSTGDQAKVLQHSWAELLALSVCWNSLKGDGDHLRLSHGHSLNVAAASSLGLAGIVKDLLKFTKQLKKQGLDAIEYAALKVIIIMTPDVTGLESLTKISQFNKAIFDAIGCYTVSEYPTQPNRQTSLMLSLAELNQICVVAKSTLLERLSQGAALPPCLLKEFLTGILGGCTD